LLLCTISLFTLWGGLEGLRLSKKRWGAAPESHGTVKKL
jgi:hypothetical protein